MTQRLDVIIKMYEKYDAPLKQRTTAAAGDPFLEEHEDIEAQVELLMQQAYEIAQERNRAIVAQRNAGIRKRKLELLNVNMETLSKKIKKGKGVTKEVIEQRQDKFRELMDRIYNIPDGMGTATTRRPYKNLGTAGGKDKAVAIELPLLGQKGVSNPLYYEHTDETRKFEEEWQKAQVRQNQALDRIGVGVGQLGDMARGMGEELDKQNPVMNEIDEQMDKVRNQLTQNNEKLKGLIHKMRSSRNFCVDVILIVIILAIGGYIYAMVR